ncbi:DUF4255 domain-containing protein [Maribellus sediminis]|uniref:DUF4255 domain-containing protein n=1 Tax=Maribellus sediminis TaxID=2696285 RepID=UPI001430CC4B|nr:DUF4255 domain-containing protein [Maribellus sediminis]
MIFETIQILKEQLEKYFDEVGLGKTLVLDNVALWESGSKDADRIEGKVIISLLNIEEETTLKNFSSTRVVNNKTEYRNPPVNLNLYLLVAANCSTYDISLSSISRTIEFFQGKKIFTSSNTVYNRSNASFGVLDHFKFVVELFTPGFEVLNNIWGTLGGRQLPSVIYKVQIIQIERDKKLASSEVITHIGGTLNDIEQ